MTRILVQPELLNNLSERLQQFAGQLDQIEGRLRSALNALPWETGYRAQVEETWTQAAQISAEAKRTTAYLAQALRRKTVAFEEADGQQPDLSTGSDGGGIGSFFHNLISAARHDVTSLGSKLEQFAENHPALAFAASPALATGLLGLNGVLRAAGVNPTATGGQGFWSALKHDVEQGAHVVGEAVKTEAHAEFQVLKDVGHFVNDHLDAIGSTAGKISGWLSIAAAVTVECPPLAAALEAGSLAFGVVGTVADAALVIEGKKKWPDLLLDAATFVPASAELKFFKTTGALEKDARTVEAVTHDAKPAESWLERRPIVKSLSELDDYATKGHTKYFQEYWAKPRTAEQSVEHANQAMGDYLGGSLSLQIANSGDSKSGESKKE